MATLTASDQYTPVKQVIQHTGFDLIIEGTFTGTISVQVSIDGVNDWRTIDNFDAPAGYTGRPSRTWYVRAGFLPGGHTSGTAEVTLA